ncbi:response regulator transcription factor [Curtobacterium sp. ER1/6]|uniref:response regulator transcription factor n=1 Tax=Curtobacterium sp. ER1/6 TaxID=1891920 RepID=UPI00084F991A|nr:response regulator transcription factor [Curtobacterium sp. ER1/6]OEI69113.1 DNA-binding response regulator [Curtobacterium sp. ER1/6]
MIRVLLVDDDADVRASIRLVLESEPDIVVVAECPDGERGAAVARRLRVDVALVDLRMPGGPDGIATTGLLRALEVPPRVVVLTAFEHDDAVLRALEVGASGFLLKGARPHELATAVRDVAADRCVLAPAVASAVVARAVTRPTLTRPTAAADAGSGADDDLADLTPRERELAVAVGEGLTNAQIAARLGVTPASAKTYVSRLLDKLGLQNRTQLAITAHRAGLV